MRLHPPLGDYYEYDDLLLQRQLSATTTPSIKAYLFTLLLLLLLGSWLPYFDHNRLLPPEPDSVQLQCSLSSLEFLPYKVVEARLTMPHMTRSDEWSEPVPLLVPSVVLKRHIQCRPTGRDYVYNQLLANISGLVDMSTVLLTERARYEQPWQAWDYSGENVVLGFRAHALDEHGLASQPIDRDTDWLTVYLLMKGALLVFTTPVAWALLQLKLMVQRRLAAAPQRH